MPDKKDLAYQDYLLGMKYKDIAEKYNVTLNTVRSWKTRYSWSRKDAHTKQKDVHTKIKPKQSKIYDKEPRIENDDLTEKQRLFCLYYIKSFNATLAAIKAGYSPQSAHVQGPRLLGNVRVKTEIKRIKREMTSDIFIEAMDVLQKYIKIAFSDITDYLTFGKKEIIVDSFPKTINYVDFNESDMIDGSIISEVKQGKDGVSIKLEDRMKALDKLSLYFDLFPDKFKRQIEEEKVKVTKDKLELEKTKVIGDEEEVEDDGFLHALEGKVSEVWGDVKEDNKSDL
jgi:phage terminase small subunit